MWREIRAVEPKRHPGLYNRVGLKELSKEAPGGWDCVLFSQSFRVSYVTLASVSVCYASESSLEEVWFSRA